jgi:hypothetical protein
MISTHAAMARAKLFEAVTLVPALGRLRRKLVIEQTAASVPTFFAIRPLRNGATAHKRWPFVIA